MKNVWDSARDSLNNVECCACGSQKELYIHNMDKYIYDVYCENCWKSMELEENETQEEVLRESKL